MAEVKDGYIGDGVYAIFYPEVESVMLQTKDAEQQIVLDIDMVYELAKKMGIVKNGKVVV